jgi:hypothetical protein
LLKLKPQAADLPGLLGSADGSQQAFRGVQRPVGVVVGEPISMCPTVADLSQL